MSKYERFIIYPLLVVALVYAFIGTPVIKARQETEVFDRIEAKEIVIKNDHDIEVVAISFYDEGGGIWTSSKDGILGTGMITDLGGGSITTYNKNNVWGTTIFSGDEGGGIVVYNKNSQPVVAISPIPEGHGGISIIDRSGQYFTLYGHKK